MFCLKKTKSVFCIFLCIPVFGLKKTKSVLCIYLCIPVFFPDEKTTSMCCWDSRNADRQRLLSLGEFSSEHHNYIMIVFLNLSLLSLVVNQ